MSERNPPDLPGGEIIVYQGEDGRSRIRVLLDGQTVWLTQALMAELYETTKQNISLHVRNILSEGELEGDSVVKESLTTAADGKRYRTLYYSLDMIIAVGYRVKSGVATKFRQWATARLREYFVKGFTLDDERLKGGGGLVDYFDELLARIGEIRASEARVYQRIREIFALATDYREGEDATQVFFATMQNKMHFAAAGMTAAEIVRRRADAAKPNMGLNTWKGGRVIKRDVVTAKNYLDASEIDTLNRITVMFLDQAEFRAQRRQDIRMNDWTAFLDKFLRDTELPVLADAGSVSHDDAQSWVHEQYVAFAARRRLAAEAEADQRYVDDLRKSAKTLESLREEPTMEKPTKKTPGRKKAKRRPRESGGE
jgi:hypothetical protein